MKRRNLSGELQRTTKKIEQYIVNPTPDGRDRMLSATVTQARLSIDLQAMEAQPSMAGKMRRGYKGPLRRAIEHICSQTGKYDLESILQVMEDEDAIDDMYGGICAPIDIHVIEVDRKSEHIVYLQRDGKEKSTSFKRVGNLIGEYKASLPD